MSLSSLEHLLENLDERFVNPYLESHKAVSALLVDTAKHLALIVPYGEDVEHAVELLVQAGAFSHAAIEKSSVASEGVTADAGAAPVAEIPPSAPEAPAPESLLHRVEEDLHLRARPEDPQGAVLDPTRQLLAQPAGPTVERADAEHKPGT